MRILLTFVQWVLSALVILFAIGFIADDIGLASIILLLVSLVLLLPPLQGPIAEKFSMLAPRWPRTFLAIFVFFISIAIADFPEPTPPLTLTDIKICTDAADGACISDTRRYPNGTSSVYLTGTLTDLPESIPAGGLPIAASIVRKTAPGSETPLDDGTTTITANQPLKLEIPIAETGIGGYEVTLPSETVDFKMKKAIAKFSVWPRSVNLDDLKALPNAGLRIDQLKTCVASLEDFLAVDGEQEQTRVNEDDLCPSDELTFAEDIPGIVVEMKISRADGKADLRLVLDGPISTQTTIEPIESGLSYVRYTLSTVKRAKVVETLQQGNKVEEGFPVGTYDLTVFPGTQNTVPIYRTFKVQ